MWKKTTTLFCYYLRFMIYNKQLKRTEKSVCYLPFYIFAFLDFLSWTRSSEPENEKIKTLDSEKILLEYMCENKSMTLISTELTKFFYFVKKFV